MRRSSRIFVPAAVAAVLALALAVLLVTGGFDFLVGAERAPVSWLIVNGEAVPGPWRASVENGWAYVNGRPFLDPKRQPVLETPPERRIRIEEIENIVRSIRAECEEVEGLRDRIDLASRRLASEPLAREIAPYDHGVKVVFDWEGSSRPLPLLIDLVHLSDATKPSGGSDLLSYAEGVLERLDTAGTLVIIENGGVRTYGPERGGEVLRAVESIVRDHPAVKDRIELLVPLVGPEAAKSVAVSYRSPDAVRDAAEREKCSPKSARNAQVLDGNLEPPNVNAKGPSRDNYRFHRSCPTGGGTTPSTTVNLGFDPVPRPGPIMFCEQIGQPLPEGHVWVIVDPPAGLPPGALARMAASEINISEANRDSSGELIVYATASGNGFTLSGVNGYTAPRVSIEDKSKLPEISLQRPAASGPVPIGASKTSVPPAVAAVLTGVVTFSGTISGQDPAAGPSIAKAGTGRGIVFVRTGDFSSVGDLVQAMVVELVLRGIDASQISANELRIVLADPDARKLVFGCTDETLHVEGSLGDD